VLIPLRIIRGGSDEALAIRISATTNSQSAVSAADLVAGDAIQSRLKVALRTGGVFYEARRGEWRAISPLERAQLLASRHPAMGPGVTRVNLREMGQGFLSVVGRPNQAKEQIAGLFKETNRAQYRSLFEDSWDDDSQALLVAYLFAHIRDIGAWLVNDQLRQLAGLGRFYVLYLVYNHVRDGFNAGRAMKDVVSDDSLIRADDSAAFIDAFDVSEVNRLANEAVLALQWVLDQNPSIDGVRALLRQGAHRAAILARFKSQV
jgi:hypothetical protein